MDCSAQNRIRVVLLAAAGFCCLSAIHLFESGAVYALCTFLWISVYLYLFTTLKSKKALIPVGAVFTVGFIIRSWGITGSAIADIGVMGLFAVEIIGVFLCYGYLTSKDDTLLRTFLFPVLWDAAHAFNTIIRLPSATRLDALFFDLKLVIQSEAFIGGTGLTFIILWIIALAVFGIRRKKASPFMISACLLLFLTIFGAARLCFAPEPDRYLKVAFTTGPYVGNALNYTSVDFDTSKNSFDSAVRQASDGGAEVLVFNEEAFNLNDSEEALFLENVKEKAKSAGMYILVGLDVADTDGSLNGKNENKMVWVDKNGTVTSKYIKNKIIPAIESDYVQGKDDIPNVTVSSHGHDIRASFAICYDSNFPNYMRRMDRSAEVVFLPSWDWQSVTAFHYRICGTIALENKVTFLKPTYDGYSAAIDPYGRLLLKESTNETGYEHVTLIDLPVWDKQ